MRAIPIFILAAVGFCGGCMPQAVDYAAPSATAIDPATRQIDYWLDQPAADSVKAGAFTPLWDAASRAARDFSFTVDLVNYREGEFTTRPLISKMPFEFWKHDVVDPTAQVECTLSTMRRTLRFRIRRDQIGAYVCEPVVVVEHYAMPERRITSVIEYQEAFSTRRQAINGASEEGEQLPVEYWYAVGRDPALERAIAGSIRKALATRSEAHATKENRG